MYSSSTLLISDVVVAIIHSDGTSALQKEQWMLRKLLSHYTTVLYVQIWENRIKVTDTSSNECFDDAPIVVIQTSKKGKKTILGIGKSASRTLNHDETSVNPFSHPRVLFSDFYIGEKLLQHAFKHLASTYFLRSRPKVIVHPMEKTEGGLTMIEKRAFRELALGAGAIDVKLHTGAPLHIENINFEKFDEDDGTVQSELKKGTPASTVGIFIFYLLFIILAMWHLRN